MKEIQDVILKIVKETFEWEIDRIIKDAQEKLVKEIPTFLAKAALEITKHVRFERVGEEVIIRVDLTGLRNDTK